MRYTLEFQTSAKDGDSLRFAIVPWDSETFGFPIIDLRLDESALPIDQFLSDWLKDVTSERETLVFTKIDPKNVFLIERLCRLGFYPVETILRLEFTLDRFIPTEGGIHDRFRIRYASEENLEELAEMARYGTSSDRFHLDPHLSSQLADERFSSWIRRAVEDKDFVLLARDRVNNCLAGFFHYRHTDEGVVELSSATVAPNYQKTGIAVCLVESVLRDCQDRGYQFAFTHTSVNNPASLNLSLSEGALIRNAQMTLHWFKSR